MVNLKVPQTFVYQNNVTGADMKKVVRQMSQDVPIFLHVFIKIDENIGAMMTRLVEGVMSFKKKTNLREAPHTFKQVSAEDSSEVYI